jgi:hypothetical protein
MGRQVLFRANDEDVAALEAEVRSRGAVFLGYYHTSPEPRQIETLAPEALVVLRGSGPPTHGTPSTSYAPRTCLASDSASSKHRATGWSTP